jgi:hypothetical protein
MKYKGYRILANFQRTVFFELDRDGDLQTDKPVEGIGYQNNDDEAWYSVIGEDNWVIQSFESVEECKQFIREEEA